MKRVEKYIIYVLCLMICTSIGTAIYYYHQKSKGLIKPKIEHKEEQQEVIETLEGYTTKNNGGLLCESRDLDCFLKTYLNILSYNSIEDIKEHKEDTIKRTLYNYIVYISNQRDLFSCEEGPCYIDINKELLDTLTYIMFGIDDLDDYNLSINENEGIFEGKNALYQVKYLAKGGYQQSIINKEIDKIDDNEYNIKLYFEGSSEDGVTKKTESGTYNLKYDKDKKLFYVNHVTK